MSSLIFLNIQVIPKTNKFQEIGSIGYFELFKKINETRLSTIENKLLHLNSYKLHEGMFINFFNIHFNEDGRIFGDLIKFDQPDAIYDTYSGKKLIDVPVGTSSRRENYKFNFKLSNHIAAIECPNGITPKKLKNTFQHFIYPAVEILYPNHVLTIDIITNSNSIEEVIKDAEYFKSIRAEITYSNQTPFERRMLRKDQELREKGITKRIVEESAPESGGEITSPTEDMRLALSLAKRLGDAYVRYRSKKTKKLESFKYSLNPFKKVLRISKKESDSAFRDRIDEAIDEAAAQANREI